MYKILVAVAKKSLRAKLGDCLTSAGYEVVEATDGAEALSLFASVKPSLVLIEAEVDGGRGMELCRQLRESSEVPLMLILEHGERELGVKSLEEGNDDFLIRPLQTREALARIKAVLRRQPQQEPELEKRQLSFDNLSIDMEQQRVIAYGRTVSLTAKEIELLWLLAAHPNIVFSRAQLLQRVWSKAPREDMRTVDTHVKKLRHKLKAPLDSSWSITTVWSVGYKFVLE